jgi:hypothetical protein
LAEAEVGAQHVIAPQALSAPVPADPAGVGDVQKMRDALADPQAARPAVPPPAPEPSTAAEPEPAPAAAPAAAVAADAAAEPAAEAAAEPAMQPPVQPPAEEPAEDVEYSFTDHTLEPTPVADGAPAINAAAAVAPAAVPARETAPVLSLEEPEQPRGRVPRWVLQGVAALLAVALIAQLVHHYRTDLADTNALRGPLTALYQSLGQPLEPRWDMANYEIRQLGASTDSAAGNLVVRASINNRARRDQPLPLLRVVMQDRFGNRVAGRDLTPAEYLGRGAPQVSLLGPGQRIDVQVALQDPGQAATGFEIDACMPGHDRSVICANDPGGH